MSKLIVEMEMPKSCAECPIGNYFHTNCPLQDDNKSYEQFQAYKKNERPSWCPIVGVLPEQHGDLIDRDVMHKDIQLWKSTATDTITMCFLYHIEKILMCIRPIIEAERKDDGTTAD